MGCCCGGDRGDRGCGDGDGGGEGNRVGADSIDAGYCGDGDGGVMASCDGVGYGGRL